MKTKMKAMLLLALLALLFVLPLSTAMAAVPAVYLGAPVQNTDGTYSFKDAYIPAGDTGTIVQLVVLDHSITLTKVQKQDKLTGGSTLYPVYKDEAGKYCYKVDNSYKLADGSDYTESTSELTPVMVYPEYVPTMTLPSPRNKSLSGYGFNVYEITDKASAINFIQSIKYPTQADALKARIFIVDGTDLKPITAKTHYNPNNQHFYQYIEGWIEWDNAYKNAQKTEVLGRGGYMAAIDTPTENEFISAFMTSGLTSEKSIRIWLGGTRAVRTGVGTDNLTQFDFTKNTQKEWYWRTEPNGPKDYVFYTGIDVNIDVDDTNKLTHSNQGFTNWKGTTKKDAEGKSYYSADEPNNSANYPTYLRPNEDRVLAVTTTSTDSNGNTTTTTTYKNKNNKEIVTIPADEKLTLFAAGDEMFLHLYGSEEVATWNDEKIWRDEATGYIVEFGDLTGNTYNPTTGKEEPRDPQNPNGGDESDNQTLTLHGNGGTFEGNDSYTMDFPNGFGFNHGTTEIVKVPTRQNYAFEGWWGDKECTKTPDIAIQTQTANANVYAGWLPHNTVTLNLNGGNWADNASRSLTKAYHGKLAATERTLESMYAGTVPVKEGYTFAGWLKTGDSTAVQGTHEPTILAMKNGSTPNTPITTTYTAQWTPTPYTATLDLAGGSSLKAGTENGFAKPAEEEKYQRTFTIEDSDIALPTPVKAGYTFSGWTYDGSNREKIPAGSTGNRTYTATWTANSYTLQLDPYGGKWSDNTSQTKEVTFVYDGADVDLTASEYIPTRAGYGFEGWFDSENNKVETFDSTSLGETLTAKWSDALAYDISYILDGGAADPVNVTSYTVESAPITLTNPNKPGYTFAGWEGTGIDAGTTSMSVTIPTGSTGNRTYTATWTANTNTVVYNLDGGEWDGTAPNTTYTADDTDATALPTNVKKTGYSFAGWKDANGNLITEIPAGSTAASTIVIATWTAKTYTITLDMCGVESELNGKTDVTHTITHTYDGLTFLPATNEVGVADDAAADADYEFVGWVDDKGNPAPDEFTNNITTDMTYYAKWLKPVVVDVWFDDNYDADALRQKVITGFTIKLTPGTLAGAITASGTGTTYVVDFGKLPVHSFNGTTYSVINYSVSEGLAYNGTDYSGAKALLEQECQYTYAESTTDLEVFFAHQSAVTTHTVELIWDDANNQDGARHQPSDITVALGYLGVTLGTTPGTPTFSQSGDTWTYTFENLQKHYKDGSTAKPVQYCGTVTLPTSTEYDVTGSTQNTEKTKTTIKLTAGVDMVGIKVVVDWKNDNEKNRPTALNGWQIKDTTDEYAFSLTLNNSTKPAWQDEESVPKHLPKKSAAEATTQAVYGLARTETPGYEASEEPLAQGELGCKVTLTPKTYVVTFAPNGGEPMANATYTYGMEQEMPVPTKAGYAFTGWTYKDPADNNNENLLKDNKIPGKLTGDLALTATWGLNPYTLTLDAQGGTVSTSSIPYTYETEDIDLDLSSYVPVRDGYKFMGWYTDKNGAGTKVETYSTKQESKTLYAAWSLQYAINYELFGLGAMQGTEPVTYVTEEGASFIDEMQAGTVWTVYPTPAAGYTFDGWYADNAYTGSAVKGIASGSTGDVTVYARWKKNITALGEWNDGDDAYGHRADTNLTIVPITENLPAALVTTQKQVFPKNVTLDQTPVEFTGLDALYKGEPIAYKVIVKEEDLPFDYLYIEGVEKYQYLVTLSCPANPYYFTTKIVWEDEDDAHNFRPDEVKVQFIGTEAYEGQKWNQPFALDDSNGWGQSKTVPDFKARVMITTQIIDADQYKDHYVITESMVEEDQNHGTKTFTFSCKECKKPVIIKPTQEIDVDGLYETDCTLEVEALNATSYQWYEDRGDGKGWRKIDGATGRTHTISLHDHTFRGYRFKCEAINQYGTAMSAVMNLNYIYADLPNTGDGSNLLLWGGLLAASGAAAALLMKKRKR